MQAEERIDVGDVMHRGVVSCDPRASGLAVARTMAAHRVHSVVVKEPGALPDVVTDVEVGAAVYGGVLEESTAAELARPAPLLRASDSLAFALERMHERRSTHAVVIDRSVQPLGVVSILDVVEALLRQHDREMVARFHG